jgi:hypothetical protein
MISTPTANPDLTPSPLSHKARGLKMNAMIAVPIRKNHVNHGNHTNHGSDNLRKQNVKMIPHQPSLSPIKPGAIHPGPGLTFYP